MFHSSRVHVVSTTNSQWKSLKETREKSAVVVALGGCACYGNITRSPAVASRTSRYTRHTCRSRHHQGRRTSPMRTNSADDQNVAVMAYLLLKGTMNKRTSRNCFPQTIDDGSRQGNQRMLSRPDDQCHQPGPVHGMRCLCRSLPANAITHEYGKPQGERDLCIKCGACYNQCPRSAGLFLMWYRTMRRSTRP